MRGVHQCSLLLLSGQTVEVPCVERVLLLSCLPQKLQSTSKVWRWFGLARTRVTAHWTPLCRTRRPRWCFRRPMATSSHWDVIHGSPPRRLRFSFASHKTSPIACTQRAHTSLLVPGIAPTCAYFKGIPLTMLQMSPTAFNGPTLLWVNQPRMAPRRVFKQAAQRTTSIFPSPRSCNRTTPWMHALQLLSSNTLCRHIQDTHVMQTLEMVAPAAQPPPTLWIDGKFRASFPEAFVYGMSMCSLSSAPLTLVVLSRCWCTAPQWSGFPSCEKCHSPVCFGFGEQCPVQRSNDDRIPAHSLLLRSRLDLGTGASSHVQV